MIRASDVRELRRRIVDELRWDSALDHAAIRVSMIEGIAMLDGAVHTFAEKCRAEELVRRIRGVAGVRNRIEVRLTIGDYRTDATLERVLNDFLDCLARMPVARPRVSVKQGWVSLEGEVPRAFQKRLAEDALRSVAGVRGIDNRIVVRPCEAPREDLDAVLSEAVRRRAIDGEGIEISAADGLVILRGTVHSCAERDELLDLAWCAPGVHAVEDHVRVAR
jgi:osmotically-inducible protein OsmY